MNQEEFEKGTGISVSYTEYARIEEVYMECAFFKTKEQLFSFYAKYDMNGIERMYADVLERNTLKRQIAKLKAELEVASYDNMTMRATVAETLQGLLKVVE